MVRFLKISIVISFIGLLSHAEVKASILCSELFSNQVEQKRTDVKDLHSFGKAMTEGMLLGPEQADIFEVYRKVFFGEASTDVGPRNLKTVLDELNKHPELKKSHFSEYEISTVVRIYKTPDVLTKHLKSVVNTTGQVRNSLYQIEANVGFWKKVLDYKDPEVPSALIEIQKKIRKDSPDSEKEVYRKAKTEYETSVRNRFQSYLNRIINKSNRELLSQLKGEDYQAKAKSLFFTLKYIQEWMEKNGRNTQFIRQAMVDVVSSVGLGNPTVQNLLKSENGLDKVQALTKLMEERDTLSMQVANELHFHELLAQLRIDFPTGSTKTENTSQIIRDFETQVLAGSFVTRPSEVIRVRSLSIQEAPFRSCLGADCSTRTYFSKALDPNFHYFTLTDSQHHSSGHLTVVLGEATDPLTGQNVKVAFADKLQNVPNHLVQIFLDAASMSLAEKGYSLAIPTDLAGHNGISNIRTTTEFLRSQVLSRLDSTLTGFTPHPHKYDFPNVYSRAYQGLEVKVYKKSVLQADQQISKGQAVEPYQADKVLDRNTFINDFLKLKNSGKPEDILKFIGSSRLVRQLEGMGLYKLSEFESDLRLMLRNKDNEFNIRKAAFLEMTIVNGKKAVDGEISQFSDLEQQEIFSEMKNWENSTDSIKRKNAIYGIYAIFVADGQSNDPRRTLRYVRSGKYLGSFGAGGLGDFRSKFFEQIYSIAINKSNSLQLRKEAMVEYLRLNSSEEKMAELFNHFTFKEAQDFLPVFEAWSKSEDEVQKTIGNYLKEWLVSRLLARSEKESDIDKFLSHVSEFLHTSSIDKKAGRLSIFNDLKYLIDNKTVDFQRRKAAFIYWVYLSGENISAHLTAFSREQWLDVASGYENTGSSAKAFFYKKRIVASGIIKLVSGFTSTDNILENIKQYKHFQLLKELARDEKIAGSKSTHEWAQRILKGLSFEAYLRRIVFENSNTFEIRKEAVYALMLLEGKIDYSYLMIFSGQQLEVIGNDLRQWKSVAADPASAEIPVLGKENFFVDSRRWLPPENLPKMRDWINSVTENSNASFGKAVQNERYVEAIELAKQGKVDINQLVERYNDKATLLMKLIASGDKSNESYIQYLLSRPEINVAVSHDGNSALTEALKKGRYDLAKQILAKNQMNVNDVLAVNFEQHSLYKTKGTALMLALGQLKDQKTSDLKLEFIKYLIARTEIDMSVKVEDKTALSLAVIKNQPELVDLIFKKMKYSSSTERQQALEREYQRATTEGCREACVYLQGQLGGKLSAQAIAESFKSAVAANRFTEAIELAKQGKVDINQLVERYSEKSTLLMKLIASGDKSNDVNIQYLLARSDINVAVAHEGESALSAALKKSRYDLAKQIVAKNQLNVNDVLAVNFEQHSQYKAKGTALMLALSQLNDHKTNELKLEFIKYLISRSDIDVSLKVGDQTALSLAVGKNQTELIELILKKMKFNSVTERQQVLEQEYQRATSGGCREACVYLQGQLGGKLSSQVIADSFKSAVAANHFAEAVELAKMGTVDINQLVERYSEKSTLLMKLIASEDKSKEAFIQYVISRPDLNVAVSHEGNSALTEALKKGRYDLAKKMLAKNQLNVNDILAVNFEQYSQYKRKGTVLMLALHQLSDHRRSEPQLEFIKYLIDRSDIDLSLKIENQTALSFAVSKNQADFVDLILKKMKFNSVTERQQVLEQEYQRATSGGCREACTYLKDQLGGKLSSQAITESFKSAISSNRYKEAIDLAKQGYVDINQIVGSETLLMRLISSEDKSKEDLIQYVLSRPDVNVAVSHEGNSALTEALKKSRYDLAKQILVKNQLNVNDVLAVNFERYSQYKTKGTALMLALGQLGNHRSSEPQLEFIKYLIARTDIDLSLKVDGKTTLSLAVIKNQSELVDLILKKRKFSSAAERLQILEQEYQQATSSGCLEVCTYLKGQLGGKLSSQAISELFKSAVAANRFTEAVELAKQGKVDINQFVGSETLLMRLIGSEGKSNEEQIQFVLSYHDVNVAVSHEGNSAIAVALKRGRYDLAKQIVAKNQLNVNDVLTIGFEQYSQHKTKGTVLMLALNQLSGNGRNEAQLEFIKYLIGRSDIDVSLKVGDQTALSLAVMKYRAELVELIKHKINR